MVETSIAELLKIVLQKYEQRTARLEEARRELDQLEKELGAEIPRLRTSLLERKLSFYGLAVCSHTGYPLHQGEDWETSQGIFSASKARLLYRQIAGWNRNGSHVPGDRRLTILCPQHFPKKPNSFRPYMFSGEADVTSSVFKVNDRLIAAVGFLDVTDVPMRIFYPEAIYQHFGLPKLPPHIPV